MQPNYLANWVQSLFSALGGEVKGKTLGLGGALCARACACNARTQGHDGGILADVLGCMESATPLCADSFFESLGRDW
jgi:hypothetical protein